MRRTNLSELLDIFSPDVSNRKGILEEDKLFLVSQKEDRASSSIGSIDKVRIAALKKKLKSESKKEDRRLQHNIHHQQFFKKAKIFFFYRLQHLIQTTIKISIVFYSNMNKKLYGNQDSILMI